MVLDALKKFVGIGGSQPEYEPLLVGSKRRAEWSGKEMCVVSSFYVIAAALFILGLLNVTESSAFRDQRSREFLCG